MNPAFLFAISMVVSFLITLAVVVPSLRGNMDSIKCRPETAIEKSSP